MKKVLIIDDQSATRDLIKWALSESGLKLHEASNGESGMQVAQQIQPDVVLLDIMMPGELDGYEVCRQLRASDILSKVKIILLSANDGESDRQKGKDVGANAYLVKPFKPATLRALVTKLLE